MTRALHDILSALAKIGGRNRQRIFISYRRRGEGAGYAGRLADRLVREFGADQCFRDIDDIESGMDFVDVISRAVGSCEVFITVMGPDWLTATDSTGQRRIDNPHDFVRLEIEAALARNIRVVPVLVGGAVMPAADKLPAPIEALSRRQAQELSDLRWEYDVGQLVSLVEKMGIARSERPGGRKRKYIAVLAAAGGSIGLIGALVANAIQNDYDSSLDMTESLGLIDAIPANTGVTTPAYQSVGAGDLASGKTEVAADFNRTAQASLAYGQQQTEDVGAAIVQAMQRANEAEIHALRSLDESRLPSAFSGLALQREVLAVASLQQAGEFVVNVLHSQTIHSIELSDDGSSAVVEAVENWSSTQYHALTRECLYRRAPQDVPQTVHLARTALGWIVIELETRGEEPTVLPCS